MYVRKNKVSILDNRAVHKNNYVSGVAAGCLKKVRLETFVFTFANNFFFLPKIDNIFLQQQKKSGEKKKNCGRPTGCNYGDPLDRKQTFFYGQPRDIH